MQNAKQTASQHIREADYHVIRSRVGFLLADTWALCVKNICDRVRKATSTSKPGPISCFCLLFLDAASWSFQELLPEATTGHRLCRHYGEILEHS